MIFLKISISISLHGSFVTCLPFYYTQDNKLPLNSINLFHCQLDESQLDRRVFSPETDHRRSISYYPFKPRIALFEIMASIRIVCSLNEKRAILSMALWKMDSLEAFGYWLIRPLHLKHRRKSFQQHLCY